MAVPTALPTSISYKGTDYPFGTPIVFTELNPTIEITFDVADFHTGIVEARNAETPNTSDYKQLQYRGSFGEVVSSTVLRFRLALFTGLNLFLVSAINNDGAGTSRQWSVSVSLSTGSSDSWQYLASTILRDTLIANLTAPELAVITQSSTYKIFWEGADETFLQPFIISQIITGGDLNSSQVEYAEMLWRVVVHTPSPSTAGQMENAIHKALTRQTPVVNFSGVESAGEIEEVTPVTDRYQVQNVPLYVSGGIYRIRLSKG